MADTPKCETCRFMSQSWNDEFGETFHLPERNKMEGICRRYPPTVWEDYDQFPAIWLNDWCGEYQPKDRNYETA